MPKLFVGILIFFLPVLAFGQSSPASSTYQPATIIEVRPHQSPGASNSDDALYEVSAVVGRTVYVVLTPSPSPSGAIRYAVGREVLVHVGDNTITWNDILGQSHEVPIISRARFQIRPHLRNDESAELLAAISSTLCNREGVAMKSSRIACHSYHLFIVSGHGAYAQDVHYDYDRGANFGSYKTYQWPMPMPVSKSGVPKWASKARPPGGANLPAGGPCRAALTIS